MKYTIAEILHYAADNCLASVREEYWAYCYDSNKEKFSCCAIEEAYAKLVGWYPCSSSFDLNRIRQGLENMGCPVDSLDAFKDRNAFSEENQQARYTWLKFAAKMAEEQGV